MGGREVSINNKRERESAEQRKCERREAGRIRRGKREVRIKEKGGEREKAERRKCARRELGLEGESERGKYK